MIGPDALSIIADQIQGSIRDLEGALNRVINTARVLDLPPDVQLVIESIADLVPRLSEPSITKETIIKWVCKSLNFSEKELLGASRQRELVRARHISMYLLKNEAGMPVTNIGRLLGNRNHSTVLHGIKAVSDGLNHDIALRNDLEQIRKRLVSV